ncbi:MAG: hypothetical protein ACYTFY_12675 [Planctomycetota bacterium]|jgi:methyl-accepting chemotaxis protein
MGNVRNLSFIIMFCIGIIITVSMAVHTVLQYISIPDVTIRQLLLQYLWHVISLSLLIYFFSWIVLQRIIVHPLEGICLHLYRIGNGKIRNLNLQSNVAEIKSLVFNVNLMVDNIKQGRNKNMIEQSQKVIKEIKDLGEVLSKENEEHALRLFILLSELEKGLLPISFNQMDNLEGYLDEV